MKTYDMMVMSWQFDKLFPGNQFVFGDFRNSSGSKTKVCIGDVTIRRMLPERAQPRKLALSVSESQFGQKVTNDTHLSRMLARMKSISGDSSCNLNLEPGEQAIDGAIRVARRFFKLINLRTEGLHRTIDDLIPHFVVYQHTLVKRQGRWSFIENTLRLKHGLHASLVNAQTVDTIGCYPRVNHELNAGISCAGCDRFDRHAVSIKPPYDHVWSSVEPVLERGSASTLKKRSGTRSIMKLQQYWRFDSKVWRSDRWFGNINRPTNVKPFGGRFSF